MHQVRSYDDLPRLSRDPYDIVSKLRADAKVWRTDKGTNSPRVPAKLPQPTKRETTSSTHGSACRAKDVYRHHRCKRSTHPKMSCNMEKPGVEPGTFST